MCLMAALWAIFGFVIPMFAGALNAIVILGFPLGFYMVAQGSLIVLVFMVFWFSRKQNAIDDEHGIGED